MKARKEITDPVEQQRIIDRFLSSQEAARTKNPSDKKHSLVSSALLLIVRVVIGLLGGFLCFLGITHIVIFFYEYRLWQIATALICLGWGAWFLWVAIKGTRGRIAGMFLSFLMRILGL